ncbi:hypothetical protein [Chishuiella sp.]|uniref:hypothetical protein n=1 Tax=Chishuiella sp. TaxID=1969467 RepID=UPI0028B00A85|nr:hypothetical protein [Chishuiella sp.]
MDYENLEINYLELSFISGLTNKDKLSNLECRDIFKKILKLPEHENVKRTDLIKVNLLMPFFKPIHSVDSRFDGMNSLLFLLSKKSKLYKNFMSSQGVIKRGSLYGGKAILLKIMTNEEKKHFYSIVNPKYNAYKESIKRYLK